MYNTIGFTGGRCGIFGGDVKKLTEDLAHLKPTVFVSVPRLYNKFFALMKTKVAEVKPGIEGCLKALLGGNVRIMVTASSRCCRSSGSGAHWVVTVYRLSSAARRVSSWQPLVARQCCVRLCLLDRLHLQALLCRGRDATC